MAIINPHEMTFEDKRFSMILYGSPGIGKTTLALSAPNPILVDFDRGVSRVSAKHRKTTIICETYEDVLKDMESPEVKAAETIIIDTGGSFITYLQDWAMRSNPAQNRQKNGAISLKGFGAVKSEFVRFTNALQYTMNKNIIYIFHSTEEKDGDSTKQRILCEGAARNLVWQPCDLGGYIQMVGESRVIGFTPTEEYFAKGCYGISGTRHLPTLNDAASNTFLTSLFEECRENITSESAVFEVEKKAYQAVMDTGKAIIESVTAVDNAADATKAFNELEHHLTSKRELKAMFSNRLKELGITWNKELEKYE
jgi:hypothetical protein